MRCAHAPGGRRCDAPRSRLYACGPRCVSHTPAALAGLPEPGLGAYCAPHRCYCGGCW